MERLFVHSTDDRKTFTHIKYPIFVDGQNSVHGIPPRSGSTFITRELNYYLIRNTEGVFERIY